METRLLSAACCISTPAGRATTLKFKLGTEIETGVNSRGWKAGLPILLPTLTRAFCVGPPCCWAEAGQHGGQISGSGPGGAGCAGRDRASPGAAHGRAPIRACSEGGSAGGDGSADHLPDPPPGWRQAGGRADARGVHAPQSARLGPSGLPLRPAVALALGHPSRGGAPGGPRAAGARGAPRRRPASARGAPEHSLSAHECAPRLRAPLPPAPPASHDAVRGRQRQARGGTSAAPRAGRAGGRAHRRRRQPARLCPAAVREVRVLPSSVRGGGAAPGGTRALL